MKRGSSYALICLGLGAFSGFIAASYNAEYMGLLAPLYFVKPTIFTIVVVSVIAPFVEEQVKPLGLYLLKLTKVRLCLGGWVALGAFAGLGFGLLENVLYTLMMFGYGAGAAMTLLMLRSMLSLPAHMIASSVAGFGVGLWAKGDGLGALAKFLGLAMVIHGLYNLTVVLAGGV